MADNNSEKRASSDNSDKGVAKSHYVLDERRRAALAEVDNAKFSCVFTSSNAISDFTHLSPRSWFHFKVCCVAGAGFFTDA
jgi:MFS transporter, PHS family, inorganic phosphate transporter